jgi:hypothetical protein
MKSRLYSSLLKSTVSPALAFRVLVHNLRARSFCHASLILQILNHTRRGSRPRNSQKLR